MFPLTAVYRMHFVCDHFANSTAALTVMDRPSYANGCSRSAEPSRDRIAVDSYTFRTLMQRDASDLLRLESLEANLEICYYSCAFGRRVASTSFQATVQGTLFLAKMQRIFRTRGSHGRRGGEEERRRGGEEERSRKETRQ